MRSKFIKNHYVFSIIFGMTALTTSKLIIIFYFYFFELICLMVNWLNQIFNLIWKKKFNLKKLLRFLLMKQFRKSSSFCRVRSMIYLHKIKLDQLTTGKNINKFIFLVIFCFLYCFQHKSVSFFLFWYDVAHINIVNKAY